MDPITLIGLLGAVTNLIHASRTVLKVAKDFRDGDNSISALSNDLLGFSEALSGFDRVLRSRHTLHRISGSAIESVIARAKKTIESLQDRLLSISSSQFSAIRRARWIQSSSAVKKLHEQLKEQNAMLQTFLTITHALEPTNL